jgi:hypothetical protein
MSHKLVWYLFVPPVLRIRFVYRRSLIRIFSIPDPVSRIPYPISNKKSGGEYKIWNYLKEKGDIRKIKFLTGNVQKKI